MKKQIKAKWVAALRSGEYEQGRGMLRVNKYNSKGKIVKSSFCCLGVLCNLHAQAHPELAREQTNPEQYFDIGGVLPDEVMKWAGLDRNDPRVYWDGRSISTRPLTTVGLSMNIGWEKYMKAVQSNDGNPLSMFNDHGLPFTDIADLIEKSL